MVETETVNLAASVKQLSNGFVKIIFKVCLHDNGKQSYVRGSTYLSDLN